MAVQSAVDRSPTLAPRGRLLLGVGALWNVAVAGLTFADPRLTLEQFYGWKGSASDAIPVLLLEDFAGCVLTFGIGYAIAATHPSRHRGLILMGILGKVGVTVVFVMRWLDGVATWRVLPPVGVDVVFAVLFARLLWRLRRDDLARELSAHHDANAR